MNPAYQPLGLMYYSGSSLRQPGYGLAYYRGYGFRQKGRGLGSFFGHLLRRFMPFARNTLLPAAQKYVLPHAKEMAKNVMQDMISQNQPIRQSLREHGLSALKGVGSSMIAQSGSGLQVMCTQKRKRSGHFKLPKVTKRRKVTKAANKKRRKPAIRRRRKRQRRDIFD